MIFEVLKKNFVWVVFVILTIAVLSVWFLNRQGGSIVDKVTSSGEIPGFKTNTNKKSVDIGKLLSGGPGKDGIPAIRTPKFTSVAAADFPEDSLGILIKGDREKRYYSYNILVWHEIVNDSIGDNHYAITFCPLCGSAIVFNRNVKGDILEFGVSGLLYESNLVMYDDKTESLWSQSRGEAIVGDFTGTKLEILPMQVIEFGELKRKYGDARVLSKDTGHFRDYSLNPYGDYDKNEEVLFPISIRDTRFPAKEIMFVVPYKDRSIAFDQIKLKDGGSATFQVDGETLTAKRSGGELKIKDSGGKVLPGYYEMWFSWAIHHQENGEVWKVK